MTRTFRHGLAAALLAAASVPTSASAQDRCISRAENQALVAHLLPDLLESVEKRCTPVLGRGTFLERGAKELAGKAEPMSRRAWPAAREALERQSGSRLPKNDYILNIGRRAITDGIANGMDAQACRTTDELLAQLAPLPPENLANVFALFLEAGLNGNPDSELRVCPVR